MGFMGSYVGMTLGPEASSTPVAGANDTVINTTNRFYTFITLPTTGALFNITGFEVLNGTVVNGNWQCFAEFIDASPPVSGNTILCAWTSVVAQSGASAVQRFSRIGGGRGIPGGTLLGIALSSSSATGRYGTTTVASSNNLRAIAQATPNNSSTTAWSAGTEEPYIKVYYKPVL